MNPPSLELHYHLKNDSHAMNAFIRNKCEAEALAAFSYIADRLGVEFAIESLAQEEGGIRDFWQFITKTENQLIMALLALIVNNAVSVWNAPPKPDKELDAINKDIAKASLEEKRLAIEKAKLELKKLMVDAATPPASPASSPMPAPALPPAPATRAGPADQSAGRTIDYVLSATTPVEVETLLAKPSREVADAVAQAITFISNEPKFITRRSNFFKALLPYNKVTAFGFRLRAPYHHDDEFIIEKMDFLKYVLKTDKLPPEMVSEALITIVAPVIDGSGMAWKGIFLDEPISFFMKDSAFKDQVVQRHVSFQHGDAIRCSLVVEKKLDETGEVMVTSRSVDVVIEKIDQGGVTETAQGKRRRFEDKNAHLQGGFEFDDAG
jgi:hypothetical protein